MATELDNLIIRPGESRDSFQKIYDNKKKYFAALNNLKTFGEEVIVAGRTKTRANVYDRGKKYLWLCYAKKWFLDTYRLYNPKTRSIILSRDVIFLNQRSQE